VGRTSVQIGTVVRIEGERNLFSYQLLREKPNQEGGITPYMGKIGEVIKGREKESCVNGGKGEGSAIAYLSKKKKKEDDYKRRETRHTARAK